MPLNTVENNRAISLQSVKFMSVVWERNSQGELCQKQCHLWAYPRLCSLRGNIRGFIPLGGRRKDRLLSRIKNSYNSTIKRQTN